MIHSSLKPGKIALAAGIAVALFGGTTLLGSGGVLHLASDVHAAQGSGQGQQGQGSGSQGQNGKQSGMRGGKRDIGSLLADDDGDDSDRPPWAGVPGNEGKPGGGSSGSDTRKLLQEAYIAWYFPAVCCNNLFGALMQKFCSSIVP